MTELSKKKELFNVVVGRLLCSKCGYMWFPKINPDGKIIHPKYCGNRRCHSPNWDKPLRHYIKNNA